MSGRRVWMIELNGGSKAKPDRMAGKCWFVLQTILSVAVIGGGVASASPAGGQAEQSPKKGAQESAQETRKQKEIGVLALPQLTAEQKQKIEAAIPQTAPVHPKRKHKMLVV